MKTIYIIGQMRKIHLYNFEAFNKAYRELRRMGWDTVINPHDEDYTAGFDVHKYNPAYHGRTWNEYPPESLFDVAACRKRNRHNVERADAIFVLKGGLGTNGLKEFEHAILMGKPVFHEEDGYPRPEDMAEKSSEMAQETIPATTDSHGGGSAIICARCRGKKKDACGFGGLPEGKDRCSLFVSAAKPDINDTLKQASDEIRSQDEMKKAFGLGQDHSNETFVAPPVRQQVLDEAKSLVCGERNESYGPPSQDLGRTAQLWTAWLSGRSHINAADVAWMMVLLKASRARNAPKKDNSVDACGYAAIAWECEQSEEAVS